MASSLSILEMDFTCPVCFDIYKDPVILSCSHSFCKVCLEKSWASKEGRECPLCRRRSSKEIPLTDRALKNACESYMQKRLERDSTPQHVLCSAHSEKLNLFCMNDEKLVCSECVAQNHQNHSFCSISKAAAPHKEQLKIDLMALQEKLYTFIKVKLIKKEMAAHIKLQSEQTEKQIRAEFEKFHQFLKEQQKFRITELRWEEEKMSWKMKRKIDELDKHIENIRGRIEELKYKLKDDALLLQDLKGATERAQYSVPDPELDDGALIKVTEHVGNLMYRLLEKMTDLSHYFPVILDPNTANSSLSLSEELSSFSCSGKKTELPDNPERMSGYHGVLGSEGFTSGTHSWDVDVEDSEHWVIGVAEESVIRKQNMSAVPENGFFCIWTHESEVTAGISKDYFKKLMTEPLRRICVMLKYENGQVCFSDLDNNKLLHTFEYRFTKKMFPYFYNMSKTPIKIIPKEVSINQL